MLLDEQFAIGLLCTIIMFASVLLFLRLTSWLRRKD